MKEQRPTKSALKRKYPDMAEESDDETSMTSDKEKDSQQDFNQSQGQGTLKPKNLFASSFTHALQSKRRNLCMFIQLFKDSAIEMSYSKMVLIFVFL